MVATDRSGSDDDNVAALGTGKLPRYSQSTSGVVDCNHDTAELNVIILVALAVVAAAGAGETADDIRGRHERVLHGEVLQRLRQKRQYRSLESLSLQT